MSEYTPDIFMQYLEEVFADGAKKYAAHGWKKGIDFDHRANHASMFRHLAESYCHTIHDQDSGLHPLQHLATRALMELYVIQHGFEEKNNDNL